MHGDPIIFVYNQEDSDQCSGHTRVMSDEATYLVEDIRFK
jgi:hypothetical protein